MRPTGKSDSVRSCVRASEAVCAREAMLLPEAGVANRSSPTHSGRRSPVGRSGVPFSCRVVRVLSGLSI